MTGSKKLLVMLVMLTMIFGVVGMTHASTVMLYSSMQEDQLLAIKKGFEAAYPDITMEYYFAGTGRVMTKIATEAQAGTVGADVIWVGDPADYISFKEIGILQQYSSPEAYAIDKAYIDPEGYYTGARLMNMGIAYNTMFVTAEEAPKTWNELLEPRWNDQVVMTDPGTSGTSKFWLNAIVSNDKYGIDFIQALKDNRMYIESGSSATHNQVAAGAYHIGVCLDYMTANLIALGSPVEFVFPEDTVAIFSPIGLVKDSSNNENGKLLYDFILSQEGQKILVNENLISVRNDVDQGNVDVDAIAKKALVLDLEAMARDNDKNLAAYDSIFGF
ncbi:MAG: ABC transporter substrate-binding protein [Limnochordia bacterium]|nr:ABC transporter substrate-binding protein [Limnochordia bacterium]